MKRPWSIVVIHENSTGREQAMKACDHLIKRFWAEREFEVSWWPCAILSHPASASEALAKAVEADVLMFAFRPESDLPVVAQEWIETWLRQRGEREGALVDLAGHDTEAHELASRRHLYLRQAAHRGGMDYLTREPQNISWSLPDSLDAATARAEQVTSVLDQILHTQPPPLPP